MTPLRRLFCLVLAAGIAVAPASVVSAQRTATRASLQSGPMVGRSEMREVWLWAQTTAAADVHFVYWPAGSNGPRQRTRGERTESRHGFTTSQAATDVEPGQRYEYEVWVDGRRVTRPYPLQFRTQTLWQWRTEPPAFRFAVGSCFYVNQAEYDRPGAPYAREYEILTALASKQPDAMLWLGDNVYYREVDWSSRSGMIARYTHTRSHPLLQPLLGSVHHYAIWDDHDYGPNDSDRSWVHKETALEVFRRFWVNPTYGFADLPGITTSFTWADVDFFLLDNRYHRTPNSRTSTPREILGARQLEWLIDALSYSRAPFKLVVVGGQVLNPRAEFETFSRIAPEERQRLIDAITAERIPGVVFLTGDRHVTELTRIDREGAYPLYDLTVSPLTAGPHAEGTINPAGVPGTFVNQRNFATLDFSGPRTDRSMKITVFDAGGRELWTRTIAASELRSRR